MTSVHTVAFGGAYACVFRAHVCVCVCVLDKDVYMYARRVKIH